ncbi:DNA mismatch repair protein MutS [Peptoniphilus koenoeneniae]|uniref:DNA mismatch repair protein MutS n=1 Tax=Peptoniphilus koenoeneniae TaxID=507751 RepID=A0ABU0ASK1_9FIRM|nr:MULTISPECIES: DNA mismatch repair protein MutS [Peptoniphilus]ERT56859.1 DNA mismatch repair protein MutS [Peptoniphilus sp. BV3C26]MDQ0274241.1 DNA mismatch repair protein MutS [Peptoniphilus koenoeneniae]
MKTEKLTPMMQQYVATKEKYKEALLFYRLGDFYEMFFDDALIASKELDLALTGRGGGLDEKIPMCGIPHHVVNQYISKLIAKGYKVAVCDQMEDPKLAKGIVKRQVTRVITPGTFTDEEYLKNDENNYLLSIYIKNLSIYISYVDYSTGELSVTDKVFLNKKELLKFAELEFEKLNPEEVIVNENEDLNFIKYRLVNYYSEDKIREINLNKIKDNLNENLKKDLKKNDLFENKSILMLFDYLINMSMRKLNHINSIQLFKAYDYLILDESSLRNLEVIKGLNTNSKKGSLLEALDYTNTSMGARLLKKWVSEPLISREKIIKRQDFIDAFINDFIFMDKTKEILKSLIDIERLCGKISLKNVNPRNFISLKESLIKSKELKVLFENSGEKIFNDLAKFIDPIDELIEKIENIIVDEAPLKFEETKFIKDGYNEELDKLFKLSNNGRQFLLDLEEKEKARTGISKLRVKYNKILGYFIEVTKSYIDNVPDYYIRKQTLVGSERYFTVELKEMESKILSAHDDALSLQAKIFDELKNFTIGKIFELQNLSLVIAMVDSLYSLAKSAVENKYKRPKINEVGKIEIKGGRHPIVEYNNRSDVFIENDTLLDQENNMLHIITGPNMAGKSTYMRQVALIVIMAQIGSFVPCEFAEISIVDRIWTRIGASDNLAKGDSTFMVEMKEVANIVNYASSKSLVILDEVGRGTSTYDGLSIAWALIEFIVNNIGAKTLFATHYHELSKLEKQYKEISNLTMEVEKEKDNIIFLRKVIPGWTDNSYGIDVARLAGIDEEILNRAQEILKVITQKENDKFNVNIKKHQKAVSQKSIFDIRKDSFLEKLQNINPDDFSPKEAINLLYEIVKDSKELK